jgi:hypothetical protein
MTHRAARIAGVAVALIGFLAAQVGFPVTVRPASASSHGGGLVRPCGCHVADDCQQCCCGNAKTGGASCCHSSSAPPCCQQKSDHGSAARVEWVIASLVQHCRGIQTSWVALGAVLPPTDLVRVPTAPRQPEPVSCPDTTALLRPDAPLDPPPRILPV